jgi:putative Mg2+ transporter-C (MgtC) family protein
MEWWSRFGDGLSEALSLIDGAEFARFLVRVGVAVVLGGVIGFERQETGKTAGMRTHMLVSLAAAFFVLSCLQAGMSSGDVSRVVQGVATGIGFLGAGAILKSEENGRVHGLTTAAGVYLATAVGIASGLGRLFPALLITLFALVILHLVPRLEHKVRGPVDKQGPGVAETAPSAAEDTHSQSRRHK